MLSASPGRQNVGAPCRTTFDVASDGGHDLFGRVGTSMQAVLVGCSHENPYRMPDLLG